MRWLVADFTPFSLQTIILKTMSQGTLPSRPEVARCFLFLPPGYLTSLAHDLALTLPSTHICRFRLSLRLQGFICSLFLPLCACPE